MSAIGARINAVLGQLVLLSDVGAVQSTERVSMGRGGHGTHKERGKAPAGSLAPFHERPLVVQYVERIQRVCEAMERDLETMREGGTVRRGPRDTRSPHYRAEAEDILREQGRPPVYLAFIYGWTEDGVRKLRGRNGLDPDTGERVSRRDILTSREPGDGSTVSA